MIVSGVFQFFSDFHGIEKTNFRCIKKKINKPPQIKDHTGIYDVKVNTDLKKLNNQYYEIFFIPNSGGFQDKDITKFNSVFIDLDCGRDKQKKYYELDFVKKYKQRLLDELNQSPLIPSYIIETRNGLHAYWLLKEGVCIEDFRQCEEQLISYFNADKAVKNPARLMRVPSFNWCKDTDNLFMTKILANNRARFDIQDILEAFPKVINLAVNSSTHNKKNYKTVLTTVGTETSNTNNLKLIKEQNIEALQALLCPSGISVNSNEDVYDYLKKQDLNEFLGLYDYNFSCIFHEDRTPSAGIYTNEETEHYIYNCLSGSCGVSYDIIRIVATITGMNVVESIRFLRKVYKINYIENEWTKEKQQILIQNQKLFLSNELKIQYNQLNKFIARYSEELYMMHEIAKKHVYTEYFTDQLGNPIYFVSSRELAKQLKKDTKTVNQRINVLVYLGLIRKVSTHEIPDHLLKKAKAIAQRNGYKYITSYYSIPEYNIENLQYSLAKAIEYKEKGFTIKGFTREMILRSSGEHEANRVYPQMKNLVINDKQQEISLQIEKVTLTLVYINGWTNEKEIIESLQQQSNRRFIYEKKLKILLPEILDKYGLIKKRLNNNLKTKLGITTKGYPNIIILDNHI